MPRIPRPYDSADPVLQPARSTAQIDERVAQRIGTAGHQAGNAAAAIGSAFGEVMGRQSDIEDSTNAARAKLEWYKFDNTAWQGLEQNAGEKGEGWQSAAQTYERGRQDILKQYPVRDPKRQADLSMFLEKQVAERGFQAARAMQGQAGKYYRGIEDQEIMGAAARVEANPTQETVDSLRGPLAELIEGGRGKYHTEAMIEQRKRQIEGALMMGQYRGLLKTDPEAAAELMGKIRAGKYEIDQAPGQQGATQSEALQPATGGGPDYRGQNGQASIRYNNPGAMYPGPSSRKFGAVATETIGGGHKIAVFPDAVSGAAAQFDLLASKYTGQSVQSAIAKWSGGNSVGTYLQVLQREAGVDPNATLTREMVQDPRIAIPLAKAMAVQEAGRPYPLSDAQWAQAHRMAFGGASEQGQQSSPVAAVNGEGQKITLNLAGLNDDQKPAALDDAVSKGYSKFLYVNDNRERVVAQQNGGQFDWQPALQKGKPFTGPAWATDVIQKNFANVPEVAQGIEAMKGALEKDPTAEVKSVVPQEALAALAQQFPDLHLPDNMTVAQAAEAVDKAVNPRPNDVDIIPMGRLQGGQVFTVNSAKHGEIKVSAEAVNALDKTMLRKLHADAKEAMRIRQREGEAIGDDMMRKELLTQEAQGKSHSEFDRAALGEIYRKNPKKLADFDRKVTIAKSMHEVTADAGNTPTDILEERLDRLRQSVTNEYGDADPAAQAAVDRADKRVKGIISLRARDPARSVRESTEVRAVIDQLPGREPKNKAHLYQLADATLKAQVRMGLPQVPITKVEADTIMKDLIFAPEKEKRRVAEDVAKRVADNYGNLADKVLAAAMKLTSGDTRDDDDMLGSAMRRLRRGASSSGDVDKAVSGAAPKGDRQAPRPNFFDPYE